MHAICQSNIAWQLSSGTTNFLLQCVKSQMSISLLCAKCTLHAHYKNACHMSIKQRMATLFEGTRSLEDNSSQNDSMTFDLNFHSHLPKPTHKYHSEKIIDILLRYCEISLQNQLNKSKIRFLFLSFSFVNIDATISL